METKRIICINQNEVLLGGLKALINQNFEKTEVVLVRSYKEAMELLAIEKYDLVIVDILHRFKVSLKEITYLKKKRRDLKILVFTESEIEVNKSLESLLLGAQGIVCKSDNTDVIIYAISTCLSGNIFITGRLRVALIGMLTQTKEKYTLSILTGREKEIITMLLQGIPQSQIIELLRLKPSTVATHKARALSKLRVKNVMELKNTSLFVS